MQTIMTSTKTRGGRKPIHAPRILDFLRTVSPAMTSRQVLDLLGIRNEGGYRPIRDLVRSRQVESSPLEPERGAVSQAVIQLGGLGRRWVEEDLQLADTFLQALERGWEWVPATPFPQVEKGASRISIIAARGTDDALGQDAARRIAAHCRAAGEWTVSYTDPNASRLQTVAKLISLRNVSVPEGERITLLTPWVSFRERTDPRFREVVEELPNEPPEF